MSAQSRKEKEVWAACDRLKKQGKKLTYRALGDMLIAMGYCRGSHSDLYRYLSSWKEQPEHAIKATRSGLPKTCLPAIDSAQPYYRDFFRLFAHHQQQCDRYLTLLSNLRESNHLLFHEMAYLHRLLAKKETEIRQLRSALATTSSLPMENNPFL